MGQGRSKDRTRQQKEAKGEAKDWKFYHAKICMSSGNARTPDAYLGKMERNWISSDKRDSEADDRYGE